MKLFKKYCVFLHLQSLIMNKREEQLNIIYLNFFMIFFFFWYLYNYNLIARELCFFFSKWGKILLNLIKIIKKKNI